MNGLRALAGLGLFLGLAGFGWSQAASTSQIQGGVQDASGLPVQGAEVKATQTDTGVARSAERLQNQLDRFEELLADLL